MTRKLDQRSDGESSERFAKVIGLEAECRHTSSSRQGGEKESARELGRPVSWIFQTAGAFIQNEGWRLICRLNMRLVGISSK